VRGAGGPPGSCDAGAMQRDWTRLRFTRPVAIEHLVRLDLATPGMLFANTEHVARFQTKKVPMQSNVPAVSSDISGRRVVLLQRLALVAALLLSFSGCLAAPAEQRPVSLYPHSDLTLPSERVARLEGYIKTIDGQNVSEGKSFELLPGCHLLVTPSMFVVPAWPRADGAPIGIDTGTLEFAVEMRAGYQYTVEVEPWSTAASFEVKVHEEDDHGATTRLIPPVSSGRAVAACNESLPVTG
jgi:hypothetical protein